MRLREIRRLVAQGSSDPELLQMARSLATRRYLAIANKLKIFANVGHHHVCKRLHGRAWPLLRTIEAPEGRTRKQLYILAHECAHVALEHNGRKPAHVQELEAEKWAHQQLRAHGVRVPRAMTRGAKEYVAWKIDQAIKRGARKIDRRAAAFVKFR
jgi:hypothetical protein